MQVDPTVTASTSITQFFGGRKVRCHTEVVEIKEDAIPNRAESPVRNLLSRE